MTRCRHFSARKYIRKEQCCDQGHDVHAWIARINPSAVLADLPCCDAEKPLFDCPSRDFKTDEEVAAERAEMKAHMDKFVGGLKAVSAMKRKMIAHGLSKATATCPWCGEKDGLHLSCAVDYNQHMRAKCDACDMGFIE